MATALILTNSRALTQKYGSEAPRIFAAVEALVRVHQKEGIESKVLCVDDSRAMRSLGGKPVQEPAGEEENKAAVDAACARHHPDYVLLLGAVDIIPHLNLENRIGDFEPLVPSDLPYACEAPFSRKTADFMNPTRIVGRLPDVTGAPGDAQYMLDVLAHATRHRGRKPKKTFRDYFALSAATFDASSRTILTDVFGHLDGLVVCPPQNEPWANDKMAKHVHFGNCHGGEYASIFFGATGCTALDAAHVEGSEISPGMVAAFAGCYGAQLYDPKIALAKVNTTHIAICNTYLRKGCVAYLGSSSISFGSPQGGLENSSLMTQFFLQHILAGLSSGEACLEARHDFVFKQPPPFDTIAERTLAEFNVFGDPTISPVRLQRDASGRRDPAEFKSRAMERAARIVTHCQSSEHEHEISLSDEVRDRVRELSGKHGGVAPKVNSCRVRSPEGFKAADDAAVPTHVHTVSFDLTEKGMAFPRFVVHRIVEADGRIISHSEHHSLS